MSNPIPRCPHWWRFFEKRWRVRIHSSGIGPDRKYYRLHCRECMEK